MIITHKLHPIDMTYSGVTQRIDVMQEDKYTRNIEMSLYANNMSWDIPSGATAVIRYQKPDGTGGNYNAMPDGSTAYSISGNTLTVALAPQVCTVTGAVELAVGLINGGEELNTFSVCINVHRNPGIDVLSENYVKLLGVLPDSGWTPNMYLGTDANGIVVAKEITDSVTMDQVNSAIDEKIGDAIGGSY